MSCCGSFSSGCDCSDATPATVAQLPVPPNAGRATNRVAVDADFIAGKRTSTVQVYAPATSPPASITVTFPLNPVRGQEIQVVAVDINVVVDGNTNNISGSTALTAGLGKTWQFTTDEFLVTSAAGLWVPVA